MIYCYSFRFYQYTIFRDDLTDDLSKKCVKFYLF